VTKRRLSKEEQELWQKVAKTADPLQEARQPLVQKSPLPPKVSPPDPVQPATIPKFKLGAKSRDATTANNLAPTLSERLSQEPVQMDQKAFARMKRGRLFPEARIDLHGMTLEQAHPALTGFVLRSYAEGKRLILVITGKGKARDDGGPIPVRFGVLKHQVPQWLRMAPIGPIVLQVTQAHQKHGGAGAYYVYLRRAR
jgi:DNA-nicking Smr family endonuclease